MAISMSPTREEFPLSRRKIIKKTLLVTMGFVIFFSIGYLISVFAAIATQNGGAFVVATLSFLVLLILIGLPAYLYQRWYFDVYYYDLTADYVVIRKGPITPREITIPYERIQDVYVDQDIFDRLFGLYDVHLSSATISSGTEAHIDGVEKPAADGLRAKLLHTVSERISKRNNVPVPQASQQ